MVGSKPKSDEVKTLDSLVDERWSEMEKSGKTWDSWEEVTYDRIGKGRSGAWLYLVRADDKGEWHMHGNWGWHKVSRVHRGPGGYHKHGYYGRHPVSRRHSTETEVDAN